MIDWWTGGPVGPAGTLVWTAPDWVMVWSFYDDPDANAFMESLYRFLTGDENAEVKGSGWFHLLREQLSGTRRGLLVASDNTSRGAAVLMIAP